MMSGVMHHMSNAQPEMSFSDTAIQHITSYLTKNPDNVGVRLSVKKTGCSGLSYVVDYVHSPLEGDLALPLVDNYQVYIDKNSYPFLKNLHVDYVKQGLNHKFIFNNPNQTGQCGCGESFTVE